MRTPPMPWRTRCARRACTAADSGAPLPIEHDRALAIRVALERSAPDDVVLIAGKGHEDYQVFAHERREFRDQAVVAAALARLPA